jgi:hypothetical protein
MAVIKLENVGKTYTHYAHGIDRLLEILTHRPRHQAFTALHPMNLDIAGTLQPDGGHFEIIDKGHVKLDGVPSAVVSAYNQFLAQAQSVPEANQSEAPANTVLDGSAPLTDISVSVDGITGPSLDALSPRRWVQI